MTTSVGFTGVLAQGKMNILFIFNRNFFLLNLIDRAVDLQPTWQVSYGEGKAKDERAKRGRIGRAHV